MPVVPDPNGEIPIYRQICDQLILGIAEGTLYPGERLPSMRALAQQAGVNVMTVNKAYQLLKQEGYIVIDRRSGARVSGDVSRADALGRLCGQLGSAFSEAQSLGIREEEILALCRQLLAI